MRKDFIRGVGNVLIIVGVGMWGVYAIGRYLFGWDITDREFLPYHLATIMPGMLFRYHRSIAGFFKKPPPQKDG